MIVNIIPSKAKGNIWAPTSKSMAHRDLICAAFTGGSEILGDFNSRDIKATLGCLKAMGAKITETENGIIIGGLNPFAPQCSDSLFCDESGSTLRFLIPLCLISGEEITLTGSERLFERPLSVYEELCAATGLEFEKGKDYVTLKGPLKSGTYKVAGNISSQFISGLLFSLPLLEGDSVIEIDGSAESLSYIKLTLKALEDFGIRIISEGESTLIIPGNQSYCSKELSVEGDFSNAAFFEALNLLGGNVTIENLPKTSFQGDRVYKELFLELSQKNTTIDITDCPDLALILFVVAAAKHGATFTGTARLKIKESDRATAMQQELSKFGARVIVGENTVVVEKTELCKPKEMLCAHNDHRIVMALSILCTILGGTIEDAEAVAKSYPLFFKDLASLGIEMKVSE